MTGSITICEIFVAIQKDKFEDLTRARERELLGTLQWWKRQIICTTIYMNKQSHNKFKPGSKIGHCMLP